jgi:TonB family protein
VDATARISDPQALVPETYVPRLALALILATACGTAALAQDATEPRPLRKVVWTALPTAEVMEKAYPEAAFQQGVGGRVVLACKVLGDGRLDACTTRSETPADQGFGFAAHSLAADFRMRATTEDGLPTAGGLVRIPIEFSPPPVDAVPEGFKDARGERLMRPRWLRKPSGAAVSRAFPRKAMNRGVSGRAIISCVVIDTGHVDNCRIVQETPTGFGFGKASLELSQFFVMQTDLADGSSTVGATVVIPLSFTTMGGD